MLPPPFHISVSSLRFLIIIVESLNSGDWRIVARCAKLSQDSTEVGTSERWPPGVLLIDMVRSYAEKCGSTRDGAALLQ